MLDVKKPRNGQYIAEAINRHAELVAENELLRELVSSIRSVDVEGLHGYWDDDVFHIVNSEGVGASGADPIEAYKKFEGGQGCRLTSIYQFSLRVVASS